MYQPIRKKWRTLNDIKLKHINPTFSPFYHFINLENIKHKKKNTLPVSLDSSSCPKIMEINSNSTTLPPGFRFHPTDEELIVHYLRNQTMSKPCPVSIIPEVDIYKFDPWQLPGSTRLFYILSCRFLALALMLTLLLAYRFNRVWRKRMVFLQPERAKVSERSPTEPGRCFGLLESNRYRQSNS